MSNGIRKTNRKRRKVIDFENNHGERVQMSLPDEKYSDLLELKSTLERECREMKHRSFSNQIRKEETIRLDKAHRIRLSILQSINDEILDRKAKERADSLEVCFLQVVRQSIAPEDFKKYYSQAKEQLKIERDSKTKANE